MNSVVNKILDKVTTMIYNKSRKSYLKSVVGKIGTIFEKDDKIICYVEQKKLDKYGKNKAGYYDLMLNGMDTTNDESRKIVDGFKLNKPVYYVFEAINFKRGLKFSSSGNAYVTFNKCTFNNSICIMYANDVVFENNKYFSRFSNYYGYNCFLTANTINKLRFINDNFCNNDKQAHPNKFAMEVKAKELEIINTKINTRDLAAFTTLVNIEAEKTTIKNSFLKVNGLCLDSKSINLYRSSIDSKNGVIIDNVKGNFVGNIDAPFVVYNGVDLKVKSEDKVKVDSDSLELMNSRRMLIERLRSLSNYCMELSDNMGQNVRDEYVKNPVSKVLK